MVSIDRVYQTVQRILNKEQRGYLPPVEFNLFANQAQIEIFEQYFYDLDFFERKGRSSMEYADLVNNIDEKIEIFKKERIVGQTANPEPESAIATINPYPTDFYRLGIVSFEGIVVEEASHRDIRYIGLSPLTFPSLDQPMYVRHSMGIQTFPNIEELQMNYISTPVEVSWAYANAGGKAVYDGSNSVDFGLHASELPDLILKICEIAGVAIRAADVTQAIDSEYNQKKQMEKL